MPFENPSAAARRELLTKTRTIAVVGLSPRQERPSHGVAKALQGFGYRIIPVRPGLDAVLGEKAYASLSEVPEKIDLVDVFRAAGQVDAVVDECLALGIPAIWIQEGIVNEAAAERARAAGMVVVMDRCIYKDYLALAPSR
jgi:predicted CoA-binding protein